jgi:uncharacterized alkaline shock family protein YloU
MTAPQLTVGRRVIGEVVRLAAIEVPGVLKVGRAGPAWRILTAGPPIRTRLRDGRLDVRVVVVARPGHALGPLVAQVRGAVGRSVERLLGLQPGDVTVVVDGIGS